MGRQGKEGQVLRLQGNQGQDRWWIEEVGSQEEQGWKDCLQEAIRCRQEVQGFQEDRRLGCRLQGRPQGPRNQGILRLRWKDQAGTGPPRQDPLPLQEVNGALRWK